MQILALLQDPGNSERKKQKPVQYGKIMTLPLERN